MLRRQQWSIRFFRLTAAESDRLNPPTKVIVIRSDADTAEEYEEYEKLISDRRWIYLGYIPRPQSHLGWFLYHLIHGLLMRYPLYKILGFAVLNTNRRGVL